MDCNNIGFHAQISLQTYSDFEHSKECKLYLHHVLREDEELFYGFSSKDEREMFRLLINVSGVGVGTARMMLSSLSCEEVREAILSENVNRIKSVKGIGLKTAQRLVLELKDKIVKGEGSVRRKGIKALVIDPYNRLEDESDGMSETKYISRQLDRLTNFAQQNDVLVILMAHPTKQTKNKDGGNHYGTVNWMFDCRILMYLSSLESKSKGRIS